MPAPALVVYVTAAVLRGDWALARHLAKQAVMGRVAALLDELDNQVDDFATVPSGNR
jgi:hypothetical protein